MALSNTCREDIELLVDTYNHRHPDAINLISKYFYGEAQATMSEITEFDENSLLVTSVSLTEKKDHKFEFLQKIKTSEEFQNNLILLLIQAREKAPSSEPLTNIEKEIEKTRSLDTYFAEVKSKKVISENIVEITLQGGLENLPNFGNDAFLYFIVSKEKNFKFSDDFTMTTYRSLKASNDSTSLNGAYYTIRRKRTNEIDVWFVLHSNPGPLANWAEKCDQGDCVALWGPRSSYNPPEDVAQYVFIADETAQPAVLSCMENLTHRKYIGIFETKNKKYEYDLKSLSDHIKWVYRDDHNQKDLIRQIVKLVEKEKNTYIFGAGEGKRMFALRRALKEKGFSARDINLIGYWKK
mgnify:CR=1 FL=1